jgi:hypothetical protein
MKRFPLSFESEVLIKYDITWKCCSKSYVKLLDSNNEIPVSDQELLCISIEAIVVRYGGTVRLLLDWWKGEISDQLFASVRRIWGE